MITKVLITGLLFMALAMMFWRKKEGTGSVLSASSVKASFGAFRWLLILASVLGLVYLWIIEPSPRLWRYRIGNSPESQQVRDSQEVNRNADTDLLSAGFTAEAKEKEKQAAQLYARALLNYSPVVLNEAAAVHVISPAKTGKYPTDQEIMKDIKSATHDLTWCDLVPSREVFKSGDKKLVRWEIQIPGIVEPWVRVAWWEDGKYCYGFVLLSFCDEKTQVAQPSFWRTLSDGSLTVVGLQPGQTAPAKEFVLAASEATPWVILPETKNYSLRFEGDRDAPLLYEVNGASYRVNPDESFTAPSVTGSYRARLVACEQPVNVKIKVVRF